MSISFFLSYPKHICPDIGHFCPHFEDSHSSHQTSYKLYSQVELFCLSLKLNSLKFPSESCLQIPIPSKLRTLNPQQHG